MKRSGKLILSSIVIVVAVFLAYLYWSNSPSRTEETLQKRPAGDGEQLISQDATDQTAGRGNAGKPSSKDAQSSGAEKTFTALSREKKEGRNAADLAGQRSVPSSEQKTDAESVHRTSPVDVHPSPNDGDDGEARSTELNRQKTISADRNTDATKRDRDPNRILPINGADGGAGKTWSIRQETISADRETPEAEHSRDSGVQSADTALSGGSKNVSRERVMVRKKISTPYPETEATKAGTERNEYNLLLEEVKRFCRYLDSRAYVREYDVFEGTYGRGLDMITHLVEKRPRVSGETQNMAALTANLFHLYRVIGGKNIQLIKEVFIHERNRTEKTMDLIYRWLIMDMTQPNARTAISLEAFYDYGAFFLSTLAGKSYLARRDSKLRILVTYYSILIVYKAETEHRNCYGIDIRPHVKKLEDDILSYKNLEQGEGYLKKLEEIGRKLNG